MDSARLALLLFSTLALLRDAAAGQSFPSSFEFGSSAEHPYTINEGLYGLHGAKHFKKMKSGCFCMRSRRHGKCIHEGAVTKFIQEGVVGCRSCMFRCRYWMFQCRCWMFQLAVRVCELGNRTETTTGLRSKHAVRDTTIHYKQTTSCRSKRQR